MIRRQFESIDEIYNKVMELEFSLKQHQSQLNQSSDVKVITLILLQC